MSRPDEPDLPDELVSPADIADIPDGAPPGTGARVMLLGFRRVAGQLRAGLLVDARAAEAYLSAASGRWELDGQPVAAQLEAALHDRLARSPLAASHPGRTRPRR